MKNLAFQITTNYNRKGKVFKKKRLSRNNTPLIHPETSACCDYWALIK